MKLTVFVGSPRGKKSNTNYILNHFFKGFKATPGNSYELFYLNHLKDTDRFVLAFAAAERVLLAHPLYTDAMPGMVKGFIEELAPLCDREGNPDLGFIVQSGFGEAEHSRFVARYHEKLARRLGCSYLGTIIKPNCEPVQVYTKMFKNVFEEFYQLGEFFGKTGQFDQALIQQMAQPESFSAPMRLFWRSMWKIQNSMGKSYWDEKLKANGAYEQRFARPYDEKE
jgi:hypothetical protein